MINQLMNKDNPTPMDKVKTLCEFIITEEKNLSHDDLTALVKLLKNATKEYEEYLNKKVNTETF